MKSATDPTEMGRHIVITVKDAAPSPSLSTWVQGRLCLRFRSYHDKTLPSHYISRILVFALSLHNVLFMGALTKIRTEMTNGNQSAFEIHGNGALMIIAILALLAVEITYGILFFTNILSTYYSNLKFFGIFSASIAPFLLLMVVDIVPQHSNWMCLLGYVLYGIAMAYSCSGDDDVDKDVNKSSFVAILTYSGLVFVPFSLSLVLFVPITLDWIVYSVIYSFFGMEFVCFLIIYFKFTYMSMLYHKKPEAQNLEAHQGIHQDKKDSDMEAQQVAHQDKF